jgi:acetolactate synthase I/II/III large subunit
MSTAKQYGATPIVVVVNNGRYGTIRMHQEKHYPGRVSGTMLQDPDFAALARAYGGHGETVLRTEEFAGAFARAKASNLPSVIELVVDEQALGTSLTLDAARAAGEAAKKQ